MPFFHVDFYEGQIKTHLSGVEYYKNLLQYDIANDDLRLEYRNKIIELEKKLEHDREAIEVLLQ